MTTKKLLLPTFTTTVDVEVDIEPEELAAAAVLAAARPTLVATTARVSWWRAERPTTPAARAEDAVWLTTLRALNASRRASAVAR